MKEEAAGLRQAPRLSRPPSPPLRIGAGGTGGSLPEPGGCAGSHPQLCLFASRTENFAVVRMDGTSGCSPGLAVPLGSVSHPGRAEVSVGPSERARLTSGHLPGFLRGSLILPRSQGAWLGRARRGTSARLPEASCLWPLGAPPCLLWGPGSSVCGPDLGTELFCGPTRGPRLAATPPRLWAALEGSGGCWTGTCGTGRSRCHLRRSTRAVQAGGEGVAAPPPQQGPCRGARDGKGRERAREGARGFFRERSLGRSHLHPWASTCCQAS